MSIRNLILRAPASRVCPLLLAAGLLLPVGGWAQLDKSNARSMAMGGAYSALARGVEAAHWNPATLGLPSAPAYSVALLATGAEVHNSSFSLADYRRYNGAFLTDDDKEIILSKIPRSGLGFYANSGARVLGFSVQRVAIAAGARAYSNLRLSRDAVDLALNGNELERTYDFDNTTGSGLAVAALSVSYGQPLAVDGFQAFAAGMTFSTLRGIGIAEVVSAGGRFRTDFNGIRGSGHADFRTAEDGSGVAIDVGAAGELRSGWTLTWGVKNLFSVLSWRSNIREYRYGADSDTLTARRVIETSLDSLFSYYDERLDGVEFNTTLPRQLLVGAARQFERVVLAFEYVQGFDNAPGVSTSPLLAMGLEYTGLPLLPLRLGLGLGGSDRFYTALGFGLRAGQFSLNLAAQANSSFFVPGHGKGTGLALDMTLGL